MLEKKFEQDIFKQKEVEPEVPKNPLKHYHLSIPLTRNNEKYWEKFDVWAKSEEELWELAIDQLSKIYNDKNVDVSFNNALIQVLDNNAPPEKPMIKRLKPVERGLETSEKGEGLYSIRVDFRVLGEEEQKSLTFDVYGKNKAEAQKRALEELYRRYPPEQIAIKTVHTFITLNKQGKINEFAERPTRIMTPEDFEKEKNKITKKIFQKEEAIKRAMERKKEEARNQKNLPLGSKTKKRNPTE